MEPRSFPIIPQGHHSTRLSLTHIYEDLASGFWKQLEPSLEDRQLGSCSGGREGKPEASQPVPNPALPLTSHVLRSRVFDLSGLDFPAC